MVAMSIGATSTTATDNSGGASVAIGARVMTPILERGAVRPDALPLDELLAAGEPVVLRGLVRDWSLVRAGQDSPRAAMDLLRSHYNGRPVQYFQRGRMEYRAEAAGTRDEVQAGAVGDEVLRLRGWLD